MAFTAASAIAHYHNSGMNKNIDQSQGSRPTSVKTTVSTDSRKIMVGLVIEMERVDAVKGLALHQNNLRI